LLLAAKNSHYSIMKILLNKGANINAQGGRYGNALQAALHKGYELVVKLLLDKGADVNIRYTPQLTALSNY
ncbi:hypothetical protein EDB80DRAFT_590283, partial [Ilyonectria destructans]